MLFRSIITRFHDAQVAEITAREFAAVFSAQGIPEDIQEYAAASGDQLLDILTASGLCHRRPHPEAHERPARHPPGAVPRLHLPHHDLGPEQRPGRHPPDRRRRLARAHDPGAGAGPGPRPRPGQPRPHPRPALVAAAQVRKVLGGASPADSDIGTIRDDYSLDTYALADYISRSTRTMLHASDSVENAERELKIWFKPNELCNNYETGVEKIFYDED